MTDIIKPLILTVLIGTSYCYGQKVSTTISVDDNGTYQSVIFYDSSTAQRSVFSLRDNNPYLNLGYENKLPKHGIDVEYNLSSQEKVKIISKFFPTKLSVSNDQIEIKSAYVKTAASKCNNLVVVVYDLIFSDGNNIVAKKSTPLVLNQNGIVISKLKESNDGYYSPTTTENNKYVAFIVGDPLPEAVGFISSPRFQVYSIQTGEMIFQIPQGDYSIYSPTSFGEYIIQVLGKSNGFYEYNVIYPDSRIVFRKEYSRAEIGNLLRFQTNGMVFMGSDGKERLEKYNELFVKINF